MYDFFAKLYIFPRQALKNISSGVLLNIVPSYWTQLRKENRLPVLELISTAWNFSRYREPSESIVIKRQNDSQIKPIWKILIGGRSLKGAVILILAITRVFATDSAAEC